MKCQYCGKEIAPNTKRRKFCSKFCLHQSWLEKLRRETLERKMTPIVCRICGKQFTPKNSGAELFCSPDCRKEARNQRQKKYGNTIITKRCAFCGKEYSAAKDSGKYCSSECRRNGRNETVRKNKAPPPHNKSLDEWAREAFACGLDYGNYRALIDRGKTYEQLKVQYESRMLTT